MEWRRGGKGFRVLGFGGVKRTTRDLKAGKKMGGLLSSLFLAVVVYFFFLIIFVRLVFYFFAGRVRSTARLAAWKVPFCMDIFAYLFFFCHFHFIIIIDIISILFVPACIIERD